MLVASHVENAERAQRYYQRRCIDEFINVTALLSRHRRFLSFKTETLLATLHLQRARRTYSARGEWHRSECWNSFDALHKGSNYGKFAVIELVLIDKTEENTNASGIDDVSFCEPSSQLNLSKCRNESWRSTAPTSKPPHRQTCLKICWFWPRCYKFFTDERNTGTPFGRQYKTIRKFQICIISAHSLRYRAIRNIWAKMVGL